MMIKTLFICFLACLTTIGNCQHYWQEQENEVLQIASREHLPVIAVFYRQEGCPWSDKLREEVLENPLFRQSIKTEAVLWQAALFGEESDHSLRDRYKITVSPLILLLDPAGKEFARLEYSPLDAQGYAMKINTLVESFQELCVAMDNEEMLSDEGRLKELYHKAQRLSTPCYKEMLMEKGVALEKGTFFHLEKWAHLLEKHKLKHPQVIKFKKQLLERDKENALGTHFKIAVLEFNKTLSRMKQQDRLEKPLKPLLQFIHQFGETDRENLWKAELMVAEYLFAKEALPQALEHAQASYEAAPLEEKPQLEKTIQFMRDRCI